MVVRGLRQSSLPLRKFGQRADTLLSVKSPRLRENFFIVANTTARLGEGADSTPGSRWS
jgi:hypothetical protein